MYFEYFELIPLYRDLTTSQRDYEMGLEPGDLSLNEERAVCEFLGVEWLAFG